MLGKTDVQDTYCASLLNRADWQLVAFLACVIVAANTDASNLATEQRTVKLAQGYQHSARPRRTEINPENVTVSRFSKKTLIDITGSEFPETNYQQPEFFFDTMHDFGDYDNEEILRQSEGRLDGDITAPGNSRSDLADSKQNELSSFSSLTQESFDNDQLEAIDQANEQAMENRGNDEETYRYDDDVNSFYPTTPGMLNLRKQWVTAEDIRFNFISGRLSIRSIPIFEIIYFHGPH